ncbi:methionine synthase reductase [Raphidocelis subcapitata]|uniref:Methionine synthase reductase n=1 Tax=Raphidocelis subcapitata TaxID=307507 RepID=A0A2V0NRG9_9CHLO|nr:methionine synthase reductase [Raphidocelis subcapitata]|eukprot:GBF89242.1 methionine synthase reductase [Raphidocelis subcapitata]
MSCYTAFMWILCNKRMPDPDIPIPMPTPRGHGTSRSATTRASETPRPKLPPPPGPAGASAGPALLQEKQQPLEQFLEMEEQRQSALAASLVGGPAPAGRRMGSAAPEAAAAPGSKRASAELAPTAAWEPVAGVAGLQLPSQPVAPRRRGSDSAMEAAAAAVLAEPPLVEPVQSVTQPADSPEPADQQARRQQLQQQPPPPPPPPQPQPQAQPLQEQQPPPAPPRPPPHALFLFGSQTGTAQEVARTLHAEAAGRGVAAGVMSLNEAAAAGFGPALAPVVVVVTSSTGDGEPPDNAAGFARALRAQPPGALDGLRFALLGLGDSNYLRFMRVPRTLRARLLELGAGEFYAAGEADAADGAAQEAKINDWCEGLWGPLKAALFAAAGPPAPPPPAPPPAGEAGGGAAADDEDAVGPLYEPDVSHVPRVGWMEMSETWSTALSATLEPGASRRGSLSAAGGATSEDEPPPSASAAAARAQRPLPVGLEDAGVPPLPPPRLEVTLAVPSEVAKHARARELSRPSLEERGRRDAGGAYSASEPLWARVAGARVVTPPGVAPPVVACELDVAAAGLKFRAGDSIGVLPQNDPRLVEALLLRLGLDGDDVFDARPPGGGPGSASAAAALLPHLELPCTVRAALSRGLEVAGAPRKGALRALAEFCGDEAERRFKSCAPPLGALIDALPPLAPRLYTVACAGTSLAGAPAERLEFAFSPAAVNAAAGPRPGVATGWLMRLLAPWLAAAGGDAPAPADATWVPVFLRSSELFTPPRDPSVPLVMVATGAAAVGAFRGFLQQWAADAPATAGGGALPRREEAWLFAASSDAAPRAEYLPYALELAAALASGELTRLRVSGEGAADRAGHGGTALGGALRADGREIADLLVRRRGRVYVAGGGGAAARDVQAALAAVLHAFVGLSESEAAEELASMAEKGEFVRELWSQ